MCLRPDGGTAPAVDDDGRIWCDAICAVTVHTKQYYVVVDIYSRHSDMVLELLAPGSAVYTRAAIW